MAVELPCTIPIPVDLAPFRAGTIWHYDSAAYAIESADLTDTVRVRHSTQPGGGGFDMAEVSLRLRLVRQDCMDHMPPERSLAAWIRGFRGDAVTVAGQAWIAMTYSADGIGRGAPPVLLDLNLRRAWWKDQHATAA